MQLEHCFVQKTAAICVKNGLKLQICVNFKIICSFYKKLEIDY